MVLRVHLVLCANMKMRREREFGAVTALGVVDSLEGLPQHGGGKDKLVRNSIVRASDCA